jgi:hypothetical protein
MDFKIFTLAKKPTTVTQQLTKSLDLRQNYLCDFPLGDVIEKPHSFNVDLHQGAAF